MKVLTRILSSPDDGQGGGGADASGAGQSTTAQNIFGGSEGSDSGSGEGGAGGEGSEGASGQAGEAQGGQSPAAGSQTPTASQAPVVSLDAIKQLAAELRGSQAQQQAPPQMTQEEFNRLFNVYDPGDDLIQALRAEDPSVTLNALKQAFQAVIRQATTVSAFHTLQELEKVKQMVNPALQFAQTQQLESMKNEFFQSYPDLKGMEPLLLQIRDSFIARNRQFDKKEDAFKAVADEARMILSKIAGLNGGGQQNNGQQGQPAGQTQSRRMPTLSGKGQGGGGQGGSGSAKSTAERIFGPR